MIRDLSIIFMKSILNNIATFREYLLISSTDFSQCRSSWPVDMFAPYCYKQYIVVKMIMYRKKCKKSHCCCWITINIFFPPKKQHLLFVFTKALLQPCHPLINLIPSCILTRYKYNSRPGQSEIKQMPRQISLQTSTFTPISFGQ